MTNWVQLLNAIIAVESSGNDMAIGDGGKARGCLQIHEIVVIDVNRRYGTHYTWQGMTNRADATNVFWRYLEMYAKDRGPEFKARVWNGGPKGNDKKQTETYWNKVKGKL